MLRLSRDEENVIYVADGDTGEQLFAIGIEEILFLAAFAWRVDEQELANAVESLDLGLVWQALQSPPGPQT